jgi:hypothetical protein
MTHRIALFGGRRDHRFQPVIAQVARLHPTVRISYPEELLVLQRVLLASCVLALPVGAHAEVLYNQTFVNISARTSDFGTSSGTGWRTYDDFVLADNASVETVSFRGLWLGPADPMLPAPNPDVTSWNFSFFADNGGFPGGVVSSQDMTPADVSLSLLGTYQWSFGGGDIRNVKIYDITATLPSAIDIAAGTRYWFSPFTLSTNESPTFAWLGTDYPSPVGNERTIQQHLNGSPTSVDYTGVLNRDRAFRLEGTVPEPASLTLLGLAGAAVLVRRRRKN